MAETLLLAIVLIGSFAIACLYIWHSFKQEKKDKQETRDPFSKGMAYAFLSALLITIIWMFTDIGKDPNNKWVWLVPLIIFGLSITYYIWLINKTIVMRFKDIINYKDKILEEIYYGTYHMDKSDFLPFDMYAMTSEANNPFVANFMQQLRLSSNHSIDLFIKIDAVSGNILGIFKPNTSDILRLKETIFAKKAPTLISELREYVEEEKNKTEESKEGE